MHANPQTETDTSSRILTITHRSRTTTKNGSSVSPRCLTTRMRDINAAAAPVSPAVQSCKMTMNSEPRKSWSSNSC